MHRYKVVVFGAGGVGKSALTTRFVKESFLSNYDPTIEDGYECTGQVDGTTYSLEILDTAGADQFRSLHEKYIRSAHGFVLVFSLTQETSLSEIGGLRQLIHRLRGNDRPIPIVVVGTKLDLVTEREVSQESISRYAVTWGVPFYETSAKRDWGVRPSFEDLIRQMRGRFPYPTKIKTRRGAFRRAKINKTFTDAPRPDPDKCLIM